jgi:DNA-binding FadR family transcriptional regulator
MRTHTLATEVGRLADREFHTALLQASGNAFLITLTSGVAAAITWTTVFKQRESAAPRDPILDHERVYKAIADANPKAAYKAMYLLIELAFRDTRILSRARKRSPAKRRAS